MSLAGGGIRDLVLVGGGHAHVIVLRDFGLRPEPGVRLTLVAREVNAAYSGMLPGLVAGLYRPEECHIDLRRLAAFAGARLVEGEAVGVDAKAKRLSVRGLPPLPYDVLSLDVGITPRLDTMDGADEHGFPVKPVSTFWPRWTAFATRTALGRGPRRVVVVGGGAAGFELILAFVRSIQAGRVAADPGGGQWSFTLVAGGRLLDGLNHRARRHAARALRDAGIALIEHDFAVAVTDRSIRLRSGREIAADGVVITTGAAAPAWLGGSGLAVDGRGFLATEPTMQVVGEPDIFAAGDCATVLAHPRPKAGVFAVRQGPPLAANLRRRLAGEPTLPFRPQKRFLMLMSEGNGRAIASWGPLAAEGRWLFRWKDAIDRRFMQQFEDLPGAGGSSGPTDRHGG